jgi:hypothetical protein
MISLRRAERAKERASSRPVHVTNDREHVPRRRAIVVEASVSGAGGIDGGAGHSLEGGRRSSDNAEIGKLRRGRVFLTELKVAAASKPSAARR